MVYTGMLNERGGFESDLTVTRLSAEAYLIVTGSAQTTRDAHWIRRHIDGARATLTDVTGAYAVLGVMGPRARDLLARLTQADLSNAAFPFATSREIWLGRALVLGQTHGHPARLTHGYARETLEALGTCPGFEAALAATSTCRYLATAPITAPVTLAFGSRDVLLLRRQSRHLDQLPPGTRAETLPGCGHVPIADDPGAVAELITRAATRADRAPAER